MEPNLRALIRAGDPDAFGLIFDEHPRAVYSLGFRLTANWSAAEDVDRRRSRGRRRGHRARPAPPSHVRRLTGRHAAARQDRGCGGGAEDTPLTFSSNYRHCPYPGDVDDPTYRFLQRLPTNPQALLRLIEREMQGQLPRPEEAFTTIGDLIGQAIAPPAVSAAL